jgi:aminodeoxyfutalosine synthase
MLASSHTLQAHAFQTDDPRLLPIKDKVLAGERLNEADALVLYGTGDILAVGWLANWVRERMHGDKAYFNVNRHINPTNVCVAACRLCAFGRKKDAPGAYTMALEEAFATAGRAIPRRSPSFTLSADCIPICRLNIFLIWFLG